jgi:hypothetical protein
MAELNDFLGGLVASLSSARVQSDIAALKIAQDYAKDNLLQNFAVPRMRIQDVEFTIPVAIDTSSDPAHKKYELIDRNTVTSTAYQQILLSLAKDKLPADVTKALQTDIAAHIQLLDDQLKVVQKENALADFSKNLALIVLAQKNLIFKGDKMKLEDTAFLSNLQNTITDRLQNVLKNQIQLTPESKNVQQVIVEAAKLREINPANIIMIKMKVSEVGMEWIKMEDKDGNVVSKLLPE